MNFWDLLSAPGDAVCLQSGVAAISYGQLADLSDSIFAEAARSTVLMLCDRNLETVAGYLGALRSKNVPILVPGALAGSAVLNFIEIYQPNYLWLSREKFGEVSALVGHCRPVSNAMNYVLLELGSGKDVPTLNNELALLLPTSGSTGDPKLVRLSYTNLQANAKAIKDYLRITRSDVGITGLPMNYSYGLSIVNSHLDAGARLAVTQASVLEKEFWSLVKESDVTNIAGVPYTFELLQRLRFERMELPSLRFMTQAGGHMGADLTRKFLEICDARGWQFFTMYGQTEATARISYVPPKDALRKLGSVGVPIPGGSVSLSAVAEQELPDGVGELVYSGPNVSLGYAQSAADIAKGDDNQGVLRTGDLARIDDEGFIYIVGRLRRYAKIYGNNVNLDHLEELLKADGIDCMAHAEHDRLEIFICSDEKPVSERLKRQLSLPQTAVKVIRISEFPTNANGKRDYKALGSQAVEG